MTDGTESLRVDQTNISQRLKAVAKTLSVTIQSPEDKKNGDSKEKESYIAFGHPVDLGKAPCTIT